MLQTAAIKQKDACCILIRKEIQDILQGRGKHTHRHTRRDTHTDTHMHTHTVQSHLYNMSLNGACTKTETRLHSFTSEVGMDSDCK